MLQGAGVVRGTNMGKCVTALAAAVLISVTAYADPAEKVDANGILQVPAFQQPLPERMSPEAKAALLETLRPKPPAAAQPAAPQPDGPPDMTKAREKIRARYVPIVKKLQEQFGVDLKEEMVGGIHAVVVTPRDGIAPRNRHRVLIGLHGGAFIAGDAINFGMMDVIPVAAKLKIKVVSLDYRMGPEHQFPAASEDVTAAYKALLKTYPAQGIGIYGCSAGGLLTAQATAWFQKEKLPRPGAIGILCAGADAKWAGDSLFFVPGLLGNTPPDPRKPLHYDEAPYYGSADLNSPLMSPIVSPEVLKQFPPTLLITGTRSDEMSTAANTQRELVKAGVEADLHVWDGMWHAFIGRSEIPEGREAQDVIVKFFDKHLKQ